MRILIDIPEEQYLLIRHYQDIAPNKTHSLAMSIINGTPLPKGHGRLIDADKIVYDCTSDVCGMTVDCYECPYHIATAEDIYKSPTIIEADKESEE